MESILEVKDLQKNYGDFAAVKGITVCTVTFSQPGHTWANSIRQRDSAPKVVPVVSQKLLQPSLLSCEPHRLIGDLLQRMG